MPRRSLRHLAPLVVGAAAMVVATVIATVVPPAAEQASAPALSAVVVAQDAAAAEPAASPSPGPTPHAADPSPASTTAPVRPAQVAQQARLRATAAAQAAAQAGSATTTSSRSSSRPALPVVGLPAGPLAVVTGVDGAQAAAKGWTLVGGDEFNGSLSDKWGRYDGAGNGGNGRRTSDAITVENGLLVIRGDANGNTGGMAWEQGQHYGKWEMRARFPAGDSQYHPVLILWPGRIGWPTGGEVDFAETDSAAQDVSFFLHYGSSNSQRSAKRSVDLTQWHDYAVEWTAQGITGYLDGVPWFSSTDPATFPPGDMHPTIQLDYFPHGGAPRPTEMYVDWMRIYR